MDNVEIIPNAKDYEHNTRLWENEALFEGWKVGPHILPQLYECFKLPERNKYNKELSLCAFVNGKHIGMRLTEPLEIFINELTTEHFDKFRENLEIKPFIGCNEYAINIIKQWLKDNHIDIKRVAHFCGLGVDPDYRRIGLGSELVKQSLEYLRKQEYQYVVVETTGDYSKKIMEKFHFQQLGFINYKDYCEENSYLPILNHQGYGIYYLKL